MNKSLVRHTLAAAIVTAFTAAALTACSVTLVGKISVKGNEPHTYLALVTRDGEEFAITGDHVATLRASYQNATLRVSGTVESRRLGPSFPARLRVERFEVVNDEGSAQKK